MSQGNIKIEVLLNKLDAQGKTAIQLPLREGCQYSHQMTHMLNQLVDDGKLSEEARDERIAGLEARTLDNETYNLFHECMGYSLETSG